MKFAHDILDPFLDFDGIDAERHSYAISYSKGVCHGVGSMVKRLAVKPALQILLTHFQLSQWGAQWQNHRDAASYVTDFGQRLQTIL
ncbi:hypothetical protein AVEN_126367-1 [Araneus ventricosus]|uniref:Uncharacterized protein n=1 Tax=Araneus ventricosus TaxID=182803 RepID=A0A4Y2FVC2_ARAVE|nr:hypothetical protein AVEN_126367-1 [Araneus ventricosus]